jgi:uncharacterized membrane protein YtjA (UPF0391 family)
LPQDFEAQERLMLRWAVIFLVIGLIAGLLGFTGVAGASIAIAKTLFFIFMVIFLVLLLAGLTMARRVGG